MFGGGIRNYRKLVTLEKPIRTPNELGEQEISWLGVQDLWASVNPLSARELNYARQAQLQTTHRVRCRWFSGLTSDQRFSWVEPDGTKRILNIGSKMDPEERHVEWVIECTERNSG